MIYEFQSIYSLFQSLKIKCYSQVPYSLYINNLSRKFVEFLFQRKAKKLIKNTKFIHLFFYENQNLTIYYIFKYINFMYLISKLLYTYLFLVQ